MSSQTLIKNATPNMSLDVNSNSPQYGTVSNPSNPIDTS